MIEKPEDAAADETVIIRSHGVAKSVYQRLEKQGVEIVAKDFAASFRRSVVDLLVDKTLMAAKDIGAQKLTVAGGVAANSLLRSELQRRGEKAVSRKVSRLAKAVNEMA